MEDYRAQFIDIYNKNVTRPGADRLLKWLEGTDFFTAPASTKFHGACECGLVMHSINVYNAMMQHFFTEGEDSPETFAVCALLHDVCKANFYKVSTRNVKNDATGQWEKVPFYQVADQLPYGHGEKSVYLIEHFMRLKTDEAIAIRWHMGGFDDAVRGGSFAVSDAYNRYPLAVKLHASDLIATYLMEQGTSNVERRPPKNKIIDSRNGTAFLPGCAVYLRQHRTIPALRLKHRSGGCGTASAAPRSPYQHLELCGIALIAYCTLCIYSSILWLKISGQRASYSANICLK